MMNAIEWIKQFAEKNAGKVCRAYLRETHDLIDVPQHHCTEFQSYLSVCRVTMTAGSMTSTTTLSIRYRLHADVN